MAKHTYKYTGEHKVSLGGYGVVNPGDTVELNGEINHPNFELVGGAKEDKPTRRSKK